MTGNTGGPHVCYRFWKNGKEVDPFKEDLPNSKPLESVYHEEYFSTMWPLKERLDCIKNWFFFNFSIVNNIVPIYFAYNQILARIFSNFTIIAIS